MSARAEGSRMARFTGRPNRDLIMSNLFNDFQVVNNSDNMVLAYA